MRLAGLFLTVATVLGCGPGTANMTGSGGTDTEPGTGSVGSDVGSGTTGEPAVCGDGVVQAPETCDDANAVNDDGCSNDCAESGRQVWRFRHDGPSHSRDRAVAVDVTADDHVYVYGEEGFQDSTAKRLWLARLDPDGQPLWTATHGNGYNHEATAMAALPDGGAVMVARKATAGAGWSEFLVGVDADGAELWTTEGPKGAGFGVAISAAGDIITAGVADDGSVVRRYSGDGTLVSSHLTGSFARDVRADGAGVVVGGVIPIEDWGDLWLRQLGADLEPMGWAVDGPVVEDVSLALFGETVYLATYGWNDSGEELVLARYERPDSTPAWTIAAPATYLALGEITADGSGNVLVGSRENVGNTEQPTVRKRDPDGDELWTWYASANGLASDVAVDSQDNVLVVGIIDQDIFAAKLAP